MSTLTNIHKHGTIIIERFEVMCVKATLLQLHMGDILYIKAPFEENLNDYYNGYNVQDIRGHIFTDRFGRDSKKREVIYMGHDGPNLLYVPLTSQNASAFDKLHQYKLKDNSMTHKATPDIESFVEVSNMRAIRVSYDDKLIRNGHIRDLDLRNIQHRVAHNTMQLTGDRDARGYIPNGMLPLWQKEMEQQGFMCIRNTQDKQVYQKDNINICRNKDGMVHYHCAKTKTEVKKMIAEREGPHNFRQQKEALEFSKAINAMTQTERKRDDNYAKSP